eukprot:3670057-Karenia_brevis.AAC.1
MDDCFSLQSEGKVGWDRVGTFTIRGALRCLHRNIARNWMPRLSSCAGAQKVADARFFRSLR